MKNANTKSKNVSAKRPNRSASTRKIHKEITHEQKDVAALQMQEIIETEKRGLCPRFEKIDGEVKSDLTRNAGVAGDVTKTEFVSALSRVYNLKRSEAVNTVVLRQINSTDTSSKTYLDEINGSIALIDELAPRDAYESLLISQMVANYNAAMDLLGRARRTNYTESVGLYTSNANKLMNTYNRQMSTLQKYREEASQTVVGRGGK